ncbi:MAG: hypothetical protein KAV83_07765, partial [Desulfobacterales bacterium]|nr:hypothetical protein [Desulfobacterales bacterium]
CEICGLKIKEQFFQSEARSRKPYGNYEFTLNIRKFKWLDLPVIIRFTGLFSKTKNAFFEVASSSKRRFLLLNISFKNRGRKIMI